MGLVAVGVRGVKLGLTCRSRESGRQSWKVWSERKESKKSGQDWEVKLFPRLVSKGAGSVPSDVPVDVAMAALLVGEAAPAAATDDSLLDGKPAESAALSCLFASLTFGAGALPISYINRTGSVFSTTMLESPFANPASTPLEPIKTASKTAQIKVLAALHGRLKTKARLQPPRLLPTPSRLRPGGGLEETLHTAFPRSGPPDRCIRPRDTAGGIVLYGENCCCCWDVIAAWATREDCTTVAWQISAPSRSAVVLCERLAVLASWGLW